MTFKKSLVSSALASSVVLAACGADSREVPTQNTTRRPIGAESPVPPLVSGEVSGTRVLHSRTDIGDLTGPVDTAASPLSAFEVAGGARQPLTVQQDPDGSFRIPDAPDGEYFLQLGGFYVATDARSLALDRYELGRRNPALASDSVLPLKLSVSNLAPVTGWTALTAASSNVNAIADVYGDLPAGSELTELTNWPMDYFDYSGSPLARVIDGGKGDWLTLYQRVDRESGGLSYSAVDRVLTPAPFVLSSDPLAPTVLSGRFEPAPQQTVDFTWARSRFEAWRTHTHPLAGADSVRGQSFAFYPTPWGEDAFYGYQGELAFGTLPSGFTDLTASVSFGNPHLSWGVAGYLSHRFAVATRLPGTTSGDLYGVLSDLRPLSAFQGALLAPRLSPPQALQVDGQAVWEGGTLASLTPRVTWSAPLLGTPSAYRVRVLRAYTFPSSPTVNRYTAVATLHTARDEVTLPPGILVPGQTYAFQVTAYLTPGVELATRPFAIEAIIDQATASTLTGLLAVPTTLQRRDETPAPAERQSEGPETGAFWRRPVAKTDVF
ncbi:hypothetical protein P2318_34285 [Myxococcaceae bacterium GXIMD 01537]